MSRICLVRHGSTSWTGRRYCGRSDPGLSDDGRSEAAVAAERLADLRLDVAQIRTSPRRRARETAERIAGWLGGAIVVDERLREVDFGAAEGLTFDEVQACWPELAARLLAGDAEVDWPDGETAAAVRARIAPVAGDLRAADRDTIIVTHDGTIRGLVALLGPLQGPVRAHPVQPGGIVVLDPAGLPGAPAVER